MSPLRPTVTCLAAAAFALAGCGDGERIRTERPILRLKLDEYRIVPQNISARPGRIKIVVRNTGRLTHNIAVQTPPKEVGDKPEEVLGARVKSMQPGQSAEPIKVTLAPGTYRLVCTIANHDDLGQYGELVIEGPPL
jgi:plastocyanin